MYRYVYIYYICINFIWIFLYRRCDFKNRVLKNVSLFVVLLCLSRRLIIEEGVL